MIFDKEEISYLSRQHEVPVDKLKDFGRKVLLLTKESLLIPPLMMQIAKPNSDLRVVSFEGYKGMRSEALRCAVKCLIAH